MTTSTLSIRLRTRTPLYTGGVDGKMDRIHETGILGSLRWWYEAIVRGLGGSACDPTTDGRCPDNEGNYCDVCAVFGATGLQRAFRMEGPVWWNEQREGRLTIKVRDNRGWFLGRGFIGQADLKFIPLRLPEGWTREDLWQSLLLTWALIAEWGGLGPKTQQGYGVVQTEFEGATLNVEQALQAFGKLRNRTNRRQVSHNNHLPSLDGFFFAKVRFDLGEQDPQGWLRDRTTQIESDKEIEWYLERSNDRNLVLPLAPVVRYHLRQLIRNNIQHNGHPNAPTRWQLMGVVNGLWHITDFGKVEEINKWYCNRCHREWDHRPSRGEHRNCSGRPRQKARCINCGQEWNSVGDARRDQETETVERQKSLIHVSHAYPMNNHWEFRIWGWIPEQLTGEANRSTVLQYLRRWLGVSQERIWQEAQTNNGTLWHLLQMQNVQVCWFTKGREEPDSYLKALLNGCKNASSRGGSGSEG